jgi:hypothetical protein
MRTANMEARVLLTNLREYRYGITGASRHLENSELECPTKSETMTSCNPFPVESRAVSRSGRSGISLALGGWYFIDTY